jgi:cytochrome c peroxidase
MLRLAAFMVSALTVPLGLDLYLPVPPESPLTRETVTQGRALFFDRRLSRDGSISCASCHRPERAFADDRPIAVGIAARRGTRHVPSLVNRGYGRAFGWDGLRVSLEAQVLAAVVDPNEMDSSTSAAARRVGLSPDALARTLASYVRSIMAGDSAYDRYAAGDHGALSSDAVQGLALFRGRANCTACHTGPNFTDERVHNTGVAWRGGALRDHGAGGGAFKTPTLRQVAHTAPYMHDGSLSTLDAVVDFSHRGGERNPSPDPEERPLGLAPPDRRALVAFLESLTGRVQEGPAVVGRP